MCNGAGWKKRAKALALAAALAAPAVGWGQVSGTWVSPFSGSWLDGANWSSNPLYPDGGGMAVFPANTWNTTTISLGGNGVTLSQLELRGLTAYRLPGGGSITLAGPAVIYAEDVAGSIPNTATIARHDLLSSLVGSAGLTKEGPGAVYLRDASYTGGTTINGGTILFDINTTGLGTAANTLTLNGGALSSLSSGTPTLNQPIVITAAGGVIGINGLALSPSQGALELNGAITGSGSLLFRSAMGQPFILGGPISVTAPVHVQAASVLRSNGAVTSTELHLSGVLTLDNGTGTTSIDRIADSIPITLNGGGLRAIRSQGVTGTLIEQLGSVTLAQGLNSISVFEGTQFIIPQIVRAPGTVLDINTGSSDVTLQISSSPPMVGSGAPGTPDVGIIPWARQMGTGTFIPSTSTALPMTIDNGYLRRLSASEYVNTVPVGVTGSNLRLAGSASVTTAATVNSLTVDAGTLSGSATLSVTSGAVFVTQTSTSSPVVIQAPLDFGTAEGVIHTTGILNPLVIVEGPISGSGGLIVAGRAELRGQSTYTGTTMILGVLTITSDILAGQASVLGTDTSAVVLGNPGRLQFRPRGTPMLFERDIHVSASASGFREIDVDHAGSPPEGVTLSGDVTLDGNLQLSGSLRGFTVAFVGDISGPGRFQSQLDNGALNSGYLRFTGDNSFAGGFTMRGSTLELGTDSALGTGTFWFGGGQIAAINGPRTIDNEIVMTGSPGGIVGSEPLTFNGSMNLLGATRTLTISNSATTTFTGPIFNGSLIKAGTGIMQTTNIRLPSFTVSQGPVGILSNGTDLGTSRTNALTIAAGASLDLTNNDLIIDYLTASPLATVQQYLADARLFSSNAIPGVTGLGYGENSDLGYTTFSGQPVDLTSLLVAYVYLGDADLDGMVDLLDFDDFLEGFSPAEAAPQWITGDFNYSGAVDLTDFELYLGGYYALGGSVQAITDAVNNAPVSESDKQAMLGLIATVPEPATMLLVLPMLLGHRRRRRDLLWPGSIS